jgi:3-oxoacyl-[acyl-carrier protein] reductase
MEFKDHTAIITGGTRGIGRAIALELARKGCRIAFNYLTAEDHAQTLIKEIKGVGSEAVGYRVNISDFDSVKKMGKEVKTRFGRLDFLVNNAGITRDVPIVMMEEKDWDDVINTNLKGVFNSTRAVIFTMMKEKRGRILNITSVSGLLGLKGQANYASSKAGVIGFTKTLAREIAPLKMTANAIALGFIDTDMTAKLKEEQRKKALEMIPLARFGTSGEVAKIAVFLLSEAARYITGQVITVDGGLAM